MDIVEELKMRCELDPSNVSLFTRTIREIDRLKACITSYKEVCTGLNKARECADDEVERLRAENNLLQAAQGMLKADVENLQSENARLRIGYDPLASKDHGEAQAAIDAARGE